MHTSEQDLPWETVRMCCYFNVNGCNAVYLYVLEQVVQEVQNVDLIMYTCATASAVSPTARMTCVLFSASIMSLTIMSTTINHGD